MAAFAVRRPVACGRQISHLRTPGLRVCQIVQHVGSHTYRNRSLALRCSSADEQLKKTWTSRDSAELYKVNGWGAPYFAVNGAGNMVVRPSGESAGEIDLYDLVISLKDEGINPPLVLRFHDIVRHRLKELHESFERAIVAFNYEGNYQGVFPIKCNPDRRLLDEFVGYGARFNFGLEAGSKPELFLAAALMSKSSGGVLVCNGYKDREFVEFALRSQQLGIQTVIVLEQAAELDLVLEVSRALGIRPLLGVRAKLSTRHDGHWGETSGDNSKFGLTVLQILHVVKRLQEHNMLDCLRLLHFHVGSQISSISLVKEAMREGSHLYSELARLGASMGYIDVGGGLAIDYDGSSSSNASSMNYSLQNYANDVVAAILDACILKGVPTPTIMSESGRALASHQAVLVFEAFESSGYLDEGILQSQRLEHGTSERHAAISSHEADVYPAGAYLLRTFREVYEGMDGGNFQEAYNDARQFKMEAESLFKLGCLSIEQRGEAEELFQAVCLKVLQRSCRASQNIKLLPASEEVALRQSLSPWYHVNLSIFKSVPDSWAIHQLFPVVPLSRLSEEPTAAACLADMTCDSDGKLSAFVGEDGHPRASLPVHALVPGEFYPFGLFLSGAYQDAMGSSHNLFGSTNVVYIRQHRQGSWHRQVKENEGGVKLYEVESVKPGQTLQEILQAAQHDPAELLHLLEGQAQEALERGDVTPPAAEACLDTFKRSLHFYTYRSQ